MVPNSILLNPIMEGFYYPHFSDVETKYVMSLRQEYPAFQSPNAFWLHGCVG